MRRLLFIPLLLFSLITSGTTYYLAPSGGSDSYAGTNIAQPWATLAKAISTLVAGDTVFIRGGTFNITAYQGISFSGAASGTAENPICYFAYEDEKPIFDGTGQTSGNYPKGFTSIGCAYVHFKGITVKNIVNANQNATGIYLNGYANNLTFEYIIVKNVHGMGYQVSGNNNYFLNCDADSCADAISAGDGWQVASSGVDYLTTFKGCRSMYCGDDGWDNFWNDGRVVYDSCWAIKNGYNPNGTLYAAGVGAGNGFKLGRNMGASTDLDQRILRNCIAADNRGIGFTENNYQSGYQIGMLILNNLSYYNYAGFQNYGTAYTTDTAHYHNNVAYGNTFANTWFFAASKIIQSHNSWNAGAPTVSSADFVTLNTALLYGDRQADGSLPEITFGKLASTSDLINAGVNVGLPYEGDAPDLGWNEYVFPAEPAAPQVNTATVIITSPTTVTVGGNTITDGGSVILTKGVYWATHSNPTAADNVIACGSGSANYTTPITGLVSGVTYYVKAYVSNAVDFGYGADESWEMPPDAPVGIGGPVGLGGKLIMHLGKIMTVP